MSFLDKNGLTYTLQKLKPIIDKKANKNDVYTKEEFDGIIACDNSEKVLDSRYIGNNRYHYIELGEFDLSKIAFFSGSLKITRNNYNSGVVSFLYNFKIIHPTIQEDVDNSYKYDFICIFTGDTGTKYLGSYSIMLIAKDKNTVKLCLYVENTTAPTFINKDSVVAFEVLGENSAIFKKGVEYSSNTTLDTLKDIGEYDNTISIKIMTIEP